MSNRSFDELFSKAKFGQEVSNHVRKSEERAPCWNCGHLTSYIDTLHLVHLCSERCERVDWMKRVRVLYAQAHAME